MISRVIRHFHKNWSWREKDFNFFPFLRNKSLCLNERSGQVGQLLELQLLLPNVLYHISSMFEHSRKPNNT